MISAAVIEALKEIVPADKVLLQEPMKLHTTFRIGGPADCLVYLENEEQLCKIQKYLRLVDVPYTVIGNGSNLLVSDQGYAGIVLVVGKHMSRIEVRLLSGSRGRGPDEPGGKSSERAWPDRPGVRCGNPRYHRWRSCNECRSLRRRDEPGGDHCYGSQP